MKEAERKLDLDNAKMEHFPQGEKYIQKLISVFEC